MHYSIIAALIAAGSAMGHAPAAVEARESSADHGVATTPQGWVDIDLVNLASDGIQKRKAMTYCATQNTAPGDCKTIDSSISGILASILKRNADSNDCSGSSGLFDGIAYSLTASPNGNCKTTAEKGTIQGGLNRYFDYLGNKMCGVHCVRLDHSGTYNAFLTLGPAGANLNAVSCSASQTYVDCGNGGQNDSKADKEREL